MASGDTLCVFTPASNVAPSANYATFDTRNGHLVLDFDQSTDANAVFPGILPRNYAGGGVTVTLIWAATGISSGNVVWNVAFERMDEASLDVDADSFATAQAATDAVPATDGLLQYTSIAFTNGAQMDSLAAGEAFRLKVTRDADNGSDTAAADAELFAVEIRET